MREWVPQTLSPKPSIGDDIQAELGIRSLMSYSGPGPS